MRPRVEGRGLGTRVEGRGLGSRVRDEASCSECYGQTEDIEVVTPNIWSGSQTPKPRLSSCTFPNTVSICQNKWNRLVLSVLHNAVCAIHSQRLGKPSPSPWQLLLPSAAVSRAVGPGTTASGSGYNESTADACVTLVSLRTRKGRYWAVIGPWGVVNSNRD